MYVLIRLSEVHRVTTSGFNLGGAPKPRSDEWANPPTATAAEDSWNSWKALTPGGARRQVQTTKMLNRLHGPLRRRDGGRRALQKRMLGVQGENLILTTRLGRVSKIRWRRQTVRRAHILLNTLSNSSTLQTILWQLEIRILSLVSTHLVSMFPRVRIFRLGWGAASAGWGSAQAEQSNTG